MDRKAALHQVYAALLWSEGPPRLLQPPVDHAPRVLLAGKMRRVQNNRKPAIILNYSNQIFAGSFPKLPMSF